MNVRLEDGHANLSMGKESELYTEVELERLVVKLKSVKLSLTAMRLAERRAEDFTRYQVGERGTVWAEPSLLEAAE